MLKKINILLVDDQQTLRNDFLQLCKDYNWNIELFNNSFQAIQEIKQNSNYDLLIIEEGIGPLNPNQFIDYLSIELNINIPTVFINNKNGAEAKNENDLLNINKPITKDDIEKIASYLNEIMHKHKTNKKAYSLNYLKQLSDNDIEFIKESLQIFKDSVFEKFTELDNALINGQYKEARKIAHNIKPSFEMLENDYCRMLCDKICYHVKEEEIPSLCIKLKEEYSIIIKELKEEFPKLD